MLHFSCIFQILLLYLYLLVGIQIFYLQSNICLKIEHTTSHCLFGVMSKYLLLPMHPVAFIFATIHVQLSVQKDKDQRKHHSPKLYPAESLKKYPQRRLERASSEQPETWGQQEPAAAAFPAEESSAPPQKPNVKKHGTFANHAVTDNTATGSLWKWFTHESSNYR